MKQLVRQLVIGICMLANASGCATAPANMPEHQVVETEQRMSPKLKRALIVGGALIVSALLVNEAQDNVQDAVRSVASP